MDETENELRVWNPFCSKILMNHDAKYSKALYLGASFGKPVSHVSDLVD